MLLSFLNMHLFITDFKWWLNSTIFIIFTILIIPKMVVCTNLGQRVKYLSEDWRLNQLLIKWVDFCNSYSLKCIYSYPFKQKSENQGNRQVFSLEIYNWVLNVRLHCKIIPVLFHFVWEKPGVWWKSVPEKLDLLFFKIITEF